MIESVTRYVVLCDGCRSWFNEGRPPLGVTPGQAMNIAFSWQRKNGKTLCDECWEKLE